MKSMVRVRACGSNRPIGATLGLIALLATACAAMAQPVPASISNVPQPFSGQAAFDGGGNVYYGSGDLPTPGAAQTQSGGGTCFVFGFFGGALPSPCPDAHVSKLDLAGNVVWSTLLGGPQTETTTAIAVDASGNVFATGTTTGQFPTTSGAAIASVNAPGSWAVKISADGSQFLYSSFLPPAARTANAIAVDTAGNAYIAGATSDNHVFATKVSPDGSAIVYSVTLAGSKSEAVAAVAVDAAGNLLVTGYTSSPDFPVTPGALQGNLNGAQDIFLARLDPSGSVLMCTYFGGSGSDSPASVAVDGAGNIDIAGYTSSLDFPTTPGTMQPTPIVPAWNNSSAPGFVAQFTQDLSALNWASYVMSSDFEGLPGTAQSVGVAQIAVTTSGEIYIGGLTGPGFPVTSSAPLICFPGASRRANGFLAHLDSHGALLDATYLGSPSVNDVNVIWGIAAGPANSARVGWFQTPNNVLSTVQFGSAGWTAPPCLSTNVLNAASQTGQFGVVPSELVTLTGFGLGPDEGVAYQPDSQGRIPTQLAGVQVLFDGVPVPVLYAQSRQINAVAPASLQTDGVTQVTVVKNQQQYGPIAAPILFGSPGIFRLQIGQTAQAIAYNDDGTLNGPGNPAARGSVVSFFATGYGLTNPACTPGELNSAQPGTLAAGATVVISSPLPDPNAVFTQDAQSAGPAAGLPCGIVRVNFSIPPTAATGAYLLLPWMNLAAGNNIREVEPVVGATIAVK